LSDLRALPSPAPPQAAERPAMDWSRLLSAAGLDATTLTAAPPEAFLPVFADSRMAWTGSYAEGRPDTIRVEAAALQGRPVYFKIVGQPWESDEFAATPAGQHFASIFLELLFVAVLVAAGLVAWRNVRLGRGDKKAAWRVAAVVFAVGAASWALTASHLPTLWELYVLLNGLSWVVFQAAFVGLLYLAVEPYVRKHWPDALISWLRIVGGRVRDPLVTSHILVGVTAGLALALIAPATSWATGRFTSGAGGAVALNGTRFFLGLLLGDLNTSAWFSTGLVLVMVLLRGVARRTWVADVLFVAILALPSLSNPTNIPGALLTFAAVVWIIRRFGLLAMVSMGCARNLVASMPLAGAGWYAPLATATPVLLAALAAWSLYVIVTSRPGASSRPVSVAQF
jgi:hypothetical protein